MEPEPFTKAELAIMAQAETEFKSELCLALCGAASGWRISEGICIHWDGVDFDKRTIDIRFGRTRGNYRTGKTEGSVRTIEMNAHVYGLLKEQYKLTGHLKPRRIQVLQSDNKTVKTEYMRFAFVHSKTNQPFIDSRQFAKGFFTPFLKELGIRHRDPNQMRHSFASHALTAGINKEWIAKQLGHEDTTMIERHYAKWMMEDAPDCSGEFSACMQDVFGGPEPSESNAPSQTALVANHASTQVSHTAPSSLGLIGQLLIALEQNPALASTLQQALSLSGGAHE
ncbi:site-specific integrase [Pseudomonadota bacterium]